MSGCTSNKPWNCRSGPVRQQGQKRSSGQAPAQCSPRRPRWGCSGARLTAAQKGTSLAQPAPSRPCWGCPYHSFISHTTVSQPPLCKAVWVKLQPLQLYSPRSQKEQSGFFIAHVLLARRPLWGPVLLATFCPLCHLPRPHCSICYPTSQPVPQLSQTTVCRLQ